MFMMFLLFCNIVVALFCVNNIHLVDAFTANIPNNNNNNHSPFGIKNNHSPSFGIQNNYSPFGSVHSPFGILKKSKATAPTHPFAARNFYNTVAYSSSSSSMNDETTKTTSDLPRNYSPLTKTDAVICGGGPAGLLSAIMLAQRFPEHKIQVFDRLSAPPSPTDEAVWSDITKFYLIGLGPRGQDALRQFGVWKDVEKYCISCVGRKDWTPESGGEGVEKVFTTDDKKVTTQVLPRDKLVGILDKHIQENYANQIQVNYGYEVIDPIDFDLKSNYDINDPKRDNSGHVLVQVAKCNDEQVAKLSFSEIKTATQEQQERLSSVDDDSEILVLSTDLLIAADGSVRTIANAMERNDAAKIRGMHPVLQMFAEPFKINRYEDDNRRVYKTIPMKLPSGDKDWRFDFNYSVRTPGGTIIFDALPANRNGEYVGVLLLKEEDTLAQPNLDPAYVRHRLDEALPQFSSLLDDETIASVAKKPPSYLPAFRYAGPRLHEGDRTVLLGDCAHTVKPYFGLGANSALEDVKVLDDVMDLNDNDLTNSVYEFSEKRAADVKTLVRISRELDRPGIAGAFTFVAPLVMDAIFYKLLPTVFAQGTIALLQDKDYTFQQVARRKRLDRLGQTVILFSILSIMFAILQNLILSPLFSLFA